MHRPAQDCLPPHIAAAFGADQMHTFVGGTAGQHSDVVFSLCSLVPEGSECILHLAGNEIARCSVLKDVQS